MSENSAFESKTRRAKPSDAEKVRSAIASLKAFQETHSLGGLSIRRLVEEARRY